ncbi:MAG: outer membrane beta-barrel protein [Candidatus Margulisiibacteriota bacterium]|jgi:opacity protein-like surface antigen
MKNLILVLILSLSVLAQAVPKITVGMNAGAFGPDSDTAVLTTFGKDFTLNGYLGLETESGMEVQASMGSYSNVSHHPSDVGTNFNINMMPLKASLLYNFNPDSELRPYLGAGVGAYFYNLRDNVYGELEKGTVFGYSLIAGVKVHFTNYLFVNAQFEKDLLPKIFFNNSKNFDSSAFTIGIGLVTNFIKVGNTNIAETGSYQYTKEQEALLVEIQQVQGEIKEIKVKAQQIEDDMDEFYYNDFKANDPALKQNFQKIQYLETKQKRLDLQLVQAQNRLDALNQRWNVMRRDEKTAQDNIVILQQTYNNSPYGLRYRDGFLVYDNAPYQYHYFQDRDTFMNPVRWINAVPATGGTVMTPEERIIYNQKKQEYINTRKNRNSDGADPAPGADRQGR